jgi:hypothetical protein
LPSALGGIHGKLIITQVTDLTHIYVDQNDAQATDVYTDSGSNGARSKSLIIS